MKAMDWSTCEDHWKDCNKKMESAKTKILEKGMPPFYIKMLVDVEDTVNALSKAALRAMRPTIGKAANNLKTACRKHNVAYATDMAECRANPSKYEADSSDDDSESSDSLSDSESESESSDGVSVDKPAVQSKPALKAKVSMFTSAVLF